jgi:hypothetical protein
MSNRPGRFAVSALVVCASACLSVAGPTAASAIVRFAVIGDFGTGTPQQYELARVMETVNGRSPFELVLMAGDNIYGAWNRNAVIERFETPYAPLLRAGVSFFASLGNHDALEERHYALFNMKGQRYYSFTRSNVQFFALDSNYMDAAQLAWLNRALETSTATWKIAFFHHPLYSSGQRHGSEVALREVVEPVLARHGVQVVFSGHDHVYERLKPQRGIAYFVCGSSGKLRRGNLDARSPITQAGYDQDQVFMVAEIDDTVMRFQAISRTGKVVDAGEIVGQPKNGARLDAPRPGYGAASDKRQSRHIGFTTFLFARDAWNRFVG